MQQYIKNKIKRIASFFIRKLMRYPAVFGFMRDMLRRISPKLYSTIFSILTSGPHYKIKATNLGLRARNIYRLQKYMNEKNR